MRGEEITAQRWERQEDLPGIGAAAFLGGFSIPLDLETPSGCPNYHDTSRKRALLPDSLLPGC